MHRCLALTALAGTAALVTACGSSSHQASPKPSPSGTPAPSGTSASPLLPASSAAPASASGSPSPLLPPSPYAGITAQALAAKILTVKDFPSGWTATPAQDSSDDSDEVTLATCLKITHEKFLDRARTMVFTKGDVSVYAQVERKDGGQFDREVAAYKNADHVRVCNIAALQTQLVLTGGVSGAKVDGVTLTVPPSKDLGIAFTIVTSAVQAEQKLTRSGAVGLFAAKPYEVEVVFVSSGAAPDSTVRDQIFATVANRLAAEKL